jgi:acetyl-CoA synthetase
MPGRAQPEGLGYVKEKGGGGGDNVHELLTPVQVSRHLQVNPETVLRWLRAERLPGKKIGKLWRISENDLNSFISGEAAHKEQPQTSKTK